MPSEHRAVLLLLALAVAGHGVRHFLSRPGQAPGAIRILGAESRSPTAHRDTIIRRAAPLAPGERIDLDRASAAEIERLPRVGPGLARRIAADRSAKGPFGSLRGLDRVPGVGSSMLEAIREHVRFSGDGTGAGDGTDGAVGADGTGKALASAQAADPVGSVGSVGSVVHLNSASAADLQRLPGIGPAKARAIVAYREAHGPFASVEGLGAVPGIGPSIIRRINGLAKAE